MSNKIKKSRTASLSDDQYTKILDIAERNLGSRSLTEFCRWAMVKLKNENP